MARPKKPASQHRVRVCVSLDKSIYENAQKAGLNVSRFCNSSLQIYLGNTPKEYQWAHEESNPESSARQADVLPFDYRPSLNFIQGTGYNDDGSFSPKGWRDGRRRRADTIRL